MKPSLILAVSVAAFVLLMPLAVRAAVPGDIDDDGHVTITDIVLAAGQYELSSADAGYDADIVSKADLAPPFGIVDIYDLVTMVQNYEG